MTDNWYQIKRPDIDWLIEGLLAVDSHSAFAGKPKSGKSTILRNLAVAVVKGRPLLGRMVYVPQEGGRVLYVHLDRKDPVHDVAEELRRLGVTEEESGRLLLFSAEDLPEKEQRLAWLQTHVENFKPNLVIIDLMFHFVEVSDANNYSVVRGAIADLQDALRKIKFRGHTVTVYHSRKMENPQEPFDDVLGSTAIRGSFATVVLMQHDRKRKLYTIQSDQTQREPGIGEILPTVLERDEATGELRFGHSVAELEHAVRQEEAEKNSDRVMKYIAEHPGCSTAEMTIGLNMSKKTVLPILRDLKFILALEGRGVANDPVRYRIEIPKEEVC